MGLFDKFFGKRKKSREVEKKAEERVFIIPIREYIEYLPRISDLLGTMDINLIYAKHKAYCASCGVQFNKEALKMLGVVGMFGGNVSVLGAGSQGNDFRSGRCPNCGHSEMKIVVD